MKQNLYRSSIASRPELIFSKHNQIGLQPLQGRYNFRDLANLQTLLNKRQSKESKVLSNSLLTLDTSRSDQNGDTAQDNINYPQIDYIESKVKLGVRNSFRFKNEILSGLQNEGDLENQNFQKTSLVQKYLRKKIQEGKKKLQLLEQEYPILKQENKKLKQEGRALRTSSVMEQAKLQWWQKYSTQKDVEAIKQINSNFKTQLKIINMVSSGPMACMPLGVK